MQTFLPYPDFVLSAQVLDRQRLGKQRVEVLQLLNTLYHKEGRWWNHPACRMWRGYEHALIIYGCEICRTWKSYGYKDSCYEKILMYLDVFNIDQDLFICPPWFTDSRLHLSHRSNLIRKKPDYYRKFWSDIPDNLPYFWPV